jgi:alkylation response protein AidB-like acyl-CoA dehydrogenase
MLWIMNVSKIEHTLKGFLRVAQRSDARGGKLGDDVRLAEAIGRLATDITAMRSLGYRGFAKTVRGEMSPEHLILKLLTSETEQRACLVAQETLGLEGIDLDGPGPNKFTEWDIARFEPDPIPSSATGSAHDGDWATQYLRSFSHTIAGGTSEIQRNIVAEQLLGLPRG